MHNHVARNMGVNSISKLRDSNVSPQSYIFTPTPNLTPKPMARFRFVPEMYKKLDESIAHKLAVNNTQIPTFETFFFVVEKQRTLLQVKARVMDKISGGASRGVGVSVRGRVGIVSCGGEQGRERG